MMENQSHCEGGKDVSQRIYLKYVEEKSRYKVLYNKENNKQVKVNILQENVKIFQELRLNFFENIVFFPLKFRL